MGLGLGEIIIILLIAFVVVGPEDLPKVARGLAKAVRQTRGLFFELRNELEMDSDLQYIKKTVGELDPLREPADEMSLIKKEIEQGYRDVKELTAEAEDLDRDRSQ